MSEALRVEVVDYDWMRGVMRETIDRFFEANGYDLPEKIRQNMSHWLSTSWPSFVYRSTCGGAAVPSGYWGGACACIGTCRTLYRILPPEGVDDPAMVERHATQAVWVGRTDELKAALSAILEIAQPMGVGTRLTRIHDIAKNALDSR